MLLVVVLECTLWKKRILLKEGKIRHESLEKLENHSDFYLTDGGGQPQQ